MTRIIIEVDGDNVNVTTETKETEVKTEKVIEKGDKLPSQYARFFDGGCFGWTIDSKYNLAFLKQQEVFANILLRKKGRLFLNDLYDMLGIPRSKAGQIVGWVYDPDGNDYGDNYVDLRIMTEINHDAINGHGNVFIIDPNVDGEILSRI